MANKFYQELAVQAFQGNVDLANDDIRAVYVNTSGAGTLYAFSQSHRNLEDVAAGARIATSATLSGFGITSDSTITCDSFAFVSVNGETSEAVVFYKHTGDEATSTLIAFIDTGTNMVQEPKGGNITVTVGVSGVGKVFPD